MNRITIIQKIINCIKAKSYLEIGVEHGNVLFNLEVADKYGIDPRFRFKINDQINEKTIVGNVNLYETTSNKFFDEYAAQDLLYGIDVAFIDGLHTYKQSLMDVKNCLKYLNKGGVIIMHDCNPLSRATAYPIKESINELTELIDSGEIPGWNFCWNGDVWKSLIHLRIESDDLEIFTLDLDWGLGVITKGKCAKLEGVTIKEIDEADYFFLEQDRSKLLNLKPPKYINEFLETRLNNRHNNLGTGLLGHI